jgi:hypothetical protein
MRPCGLAPQSRTSILAEPYASWHCRQIHQQLKCLCLSISPNGHVRSGSGYRLPPLTSRNNERRRRRSARTVLCTCGRFDPVNSPPMLTLALRAACKLDPGALQVILPSRVGHGHRRWHQHSLQVILFRNSQNSELFIASTVTRSTLRPRACKRNASGLTIYSCCRSLSPCPHRCTRIGRSSAAPHCRSRNLLAPRCSGTRLT